MLKAILFDLDGTLVDSKIDFLKMKRQSIAHLEASGVKRGILSENMLNYDIERQAVAYLRQEGIRLEEIQSILQKIEEIMNKIELEALETVTLVDGAQDILKELRRKALKTGIASRGCRDYVTKVLKKLGLNQFFNAIVARDDVMKPKPDPEHLQHLMRLLLVKPSETILIGDHFVDIQSAQKAGLKSVWLNRKSKKSLENIKPDYEISTLLKLLKIIEQHQ